MNQKILLDVSEAEGRLRWDELAVALVLAAGGQIEVPDTLLEDPNSEHYLDFERSPGFSGVMVRAVRRQSSEADERLAPGDPG